MESNDNKFKCLVGIETDKGRLRLRLPRSLYGGKQKYIALSLIDNEQNRRVAEIKQRQAELDILADHFDHTWQKYRVINHLNLITPDVSFYDLWERFCQYKEPRLAKATRSKYASATALLKAYGKGISSEDDVLLYVGFERRRGNKERTIKDRLSLLKACGNWGVKRKLIQSNPFDEALALVTAEPLEEPDPFHKEEVRAILAGFESDHYYKPYVGFVKFLFFTGARISEVIGLRWGRVKEDFSVITFMESLTRGDRRSTKTGEVRLFPCSGKIVELLREIKPEGCGRDDLVFPSPEGLAIDDHNFSQRAWKKVLEKAGVRHRVPYNCRHTFISHCVSQKMDLKKIATLAGNSPEVILERYLGNVEDIEVPDLYF